jgi:hypothetical protein
MEYIFIVNLVGDINDNVGRIWFGGEIGTSSIISVYPVFSR